MPVIKLFDYQLDAVGRMKNGCILCGGVGSGKSRTALAYFWQTEVADLSRLRPEKGKHVRDLYIITTARKRDICEWEGELANFRISKNPKASVLKNQIVVDSWNNIQKYKDVNDAFFLFDEQRVVGKGAWVKAFLKIAKRNHWILLSATPGDTWSDYVPVFLANGFFGSRKDFTDQHVVYARWCTKYPKIDRYLNTRRLTRLRDSILVDMDFQRKTVAHHEDVFVEYNFIIYKDIFRNRWDPYKNEPIRTASELCYLLRKVTNSDDSRQTALLEIVEKHPRCIIFYNFDYELDILKSLYYGEDVEIAEWNGHKHQEIPEGEKWVYLVQYTAGCEGWNCIKTDTIIFFSQNYSYKVLKQAEGRIDRLNTPYTDLYYYHLRSRSSIDIGITRALREKKNFNEGRFVQKPSVAKKVA